MGILVDGGGRKPRVGGRKKRHSGGEEWSDREKEWEGVKHQKQVVNVRIYNNEQHILFRH